MSRIVIAFSICCLAVLGFVSMAAAAPFATDIAAQVAPRDLFVPVDFKCGMVNDKLVCGSTKGNKNRDDDDDGDDDRPKKSKDKVIPKTCGKKVNCEAGFVKLEKPNKYGACCEAREGLPPAKCKFPGQIDPPKCDCPPGTEFMGYKGCLPKKAEPPAKKGGSYCSKEVPESMVPLAKQTCTNNHPGGWLNCSIPKPGFVICCCNWL